MTKSKSGVAWGWGERRASGERRARRERLPRSTTTLPGGDGYFHYLNHGVYMSKLTRLHPVNMCSSLCNNYTSIKINKYQEKYKQASAVKTNHLGMGK